MPTIRALTVLVLLAPASAFAADIVYTGTLGRQPIELVLNYTGEGTVPAAYAYAKYDTPIRIEGGTSDGGLTLYEQGDGGVLVATLTLAPFDPAAETLAGEWIAADGGKRLPVALTQQYSIDYGDEGGREVLQAASTAEHYFRVVVGDDRQATALKVFRKGTDALLQTLKVDANYVGIDGLSVADFDFDGRDDVSLFERSYAGANTSTLYFLWDADAGRYVDSGFTGVSLEFDADKKLIYEHNTCCMGRSIIDATYRVEHRKMVLVERRCTEYDEEEGDHVEVECSENE